MCAPRSTNNTSDAADPATKGYFINHLCLDVKNATRSIEFYFSVVGLRHIFTLHVSTHVSITHRGHSQGGKNGTSYQTVEELYRNKKNIEGLIELIALDVPDNYLLLSTAMPNTFSHIGMAVPDLMATQERL